MSSRQLRKLERKRLKDKALEANSSDEAEDNYDVKPNSQKNFNAFDFLEGDEDKESESDNDVDQSQDSPPKKIETKAKPAKNKKKKHKKNQKVVEENSDDELDKILAEAKAKDDEKFKDHGNDDTNESEEQFEITTDFEQEYNEIIEPILVYDSNFKNFTTERLKQSLALLSIGSAKNLDPDEELKNLFGNLSLETIEDANTTTSLSITPDVLKQFKRLARLTKGWGGKDRRSVPGNNNRKLLLTRIRDDYLPTTIKPLSMDELTNHEVLEIFDYKEDVAEVEELQSKISKERELGVKYFKFKKNTDARERVASTQFYASVVISPDHEALMALLRSSPYHTETLLQVSMVILRQGNEKSTSNALLEKCLFVFDRSFHMFFHDLIEEAKNGLLRLPYESFMNRQFYLCIFRYIISLAERATYFTSFSYCKFLLSVNPAEDPLGVRYFIDFYAIMSGEYKFLTQLIDSPLVTCYSKWLTPGIAFSTVLAYIHLDDWVNAKVFLKKAHTAHPYTSYKLLENVCLSGDIPIRESDIYINDEILLSTESYMVRAKVIWNDTEKIKFLSDELTRLFIEDKVKGQDTNTNTFASRMTNLFFSNSENKKEKIDNELPFNLLRFAILSGENSLLGKVPQSIWDRDDVYEFDPLPPKSTTLGYEPITGVNPESKIIDYAYDYVDHNILTSIIQNRTQEDEFEDIVRQLQQQ